MSDPSNVREGCCQSWPKPCSYHEGWLDGWEAAAGTTGDVCDPWPCANCAALEDHLEAVSSELAEAEAELRYR